MRWIAVFLLLFCSNVGLAAEDEQTDAAVDKRLDVLYGEHQIYRQFFDVQKKAIVGRDKTTVAKLVSYPLYVIYKSKNLIVKSERDFVARYGQIINDRVYQAVKSQQYKDLFANSRGLMIGRGEVWFSGICVEKTQANPCSKAVVKIVGINPDAPR